jgi:tetratricopeptide (TPR) repeat protein
LNATISLIAIMSGFALISSADAAVSVLGSGLAQDCFHSAEFGGDLNDGVQVCTRALEETALSTADKAATLINRGILYARSNRVDNAIADYDHGLKLDGALGEGYVDRGACEILQRDFETALTDINKGIELHSNKLEIAYYDRAVVDEALGNVKGAYEDYKMAIQLAPDFALASEQLSRFKVVRKGSTGT